MAPVLWSQSVLTHFVISFIIYCCDRPFHSLSVFLLHLLLRSAKCQRRQNKRPRLVTYVHNLAKKQSSKLICADKKHFLVDQAIGPN